MSEDVDATGTGQWREQSAASAEGGPPEEDVLVSVRNLKTYYDEGGLGGDPVRAVDGVSFDIHRGETLGLVGESGCGKTTLGRTLVRLERPTAGEVRFDGEDVTTLSGRDLARWRRNAQIVFQDPESSLNNRMTVGEIVREPLDVHDWPHLAVRVEGEPEIEVTGDGTAAPPDATGNDVDLTVNGRGGSEDVSIREAIPLDPEDVRVQVDRRNGEVSSVNVQIRPSKAMLRRDHVRNLLDTVGLAEDHYYRYPHQFSGGQRQRIGIARALALEPEFVVLDEPVSALDVSVQAKILNLLSDLQEQFGLTYLLIAHDLAVVRHVCDRVAVMYLGNVMELGPTESLFGDPANPYTHSLLSAIPEPDPTSEREPITLRGTPPSPRYPPSGCPLSTRCPAKIRPDELSHLDEETWLSLDELARVIRERQRADRTLRERIAGWLGRETRFSSPNELVAELFASSDDLPREPTPAVEAAAIVDAMDPTLADHVETILEYLEDGEEREALAYMDEAMGSECDAEHPDFYEVGDAGRVSACHRHRPSFRSVEDVLEARFGGHE